jgi:fatty acid desaturase
VTGVLTATPYSEWRHEHAIHHATAGDLDRRGHGDIATLPSTSISRRVGRLRYWLHGTVVMPSRAGLPDDWRRIGPVKSSGSQRPRRLVHEPRPAV